MDFIHAPVGIFMASFQRKQGDMMAGIGPEEQVVLRAMRRALDNVRRWPGSTGKYVEIWPKSQQTKTKKRGGFPAGLVAVKKGRRGWGQVVPALQRTTPRSAVIFRIPFQLKLIHFFYNYRSKIKIYMNLICIC